MTMTHTQELKELIDATPGCSKTKQAVFDQIIFQFAGRKVFIRTMSSQDRESQIAERVGACKKMLESGYSYSDCAKTIRERFGSSKYLTRKYMEQAMEERRPSYAKH